RPGGAGLPCPQLFRQRSFQPLALEVALRPRRPRHLPHQPEAQSEKDQARQSEVDEHVHGQRRPSPRREPIWTTRGGRPPPSFAASSGRCSFTYATIRSRANIVPVRRGAPFSIVSPSPPLARKSVTATVYVPGAQADAHDSSVQLRVSQRISPDSSIIRTTMAPAGARFTSSAAPKRLQSITYRSPD